MADFNDACLGSEFKELAKNLEQFSTLVKAKALGYN